MKKIPSLFVRDWGGNRSLVTREVDPACAWVLAGEGRPTRKWDGTACRVTHDPALRLWKRYDAKGGKAPPPGFEPAQDSDPKTGHWPGWVPVGDGPEDRWHREGMAQLTALSICYDPVDGTYELIGPMVGGNSECRLTHGLVLHGDHDLNLSVGFLCASDAYDRIRSFLLLNPMEGIVWHHPDGRMAKAKARDFGLTWPARVAVGGYPGRILA